MFSPFQCSHGVFRWCKRWRRSRRWGWAVWTCRWSRLRRRCFWSYCPGSECRLCDGCWWLGSGGWSWWLWWVNRVANWNSIRSIDDVFIRFRCSKVWVFPIFDRTCISWYSKSESLDLLYVLLIVWGLVLKGRRCGIDWVQFLKTPFWVSLVVLVDCSYRLCSGLFYSPWVWRTCL